MKHIKSFAIFEARNKPEVVSYLNEILETLKLDGFDVSISVNEPSLFLRGFSRVVGAGKIADIAIHIEKRQGLRYDEIGPYVDHVISYLKEQQYQIYDLSVSLIERHVTSNGRVITYPDTIDYIDDGKFNKKIPGATKENTDWVYAHLNSLEQINSLGQENNLVTSAKILFVKS
jgi:hypothetical protein